jgi:hypothetical protein
MTKATAFAAATCGLLSVSSAFAQTTVFTDNFSNGSTLNGTSTPGGTPTASSTSYDIASSKPDTTYPTIGPGALGLGLNAATTSGFWEAQAVFSSGPITLQTVGDYINLTYTFTDTGALLMGNTSSSIFAGLYDGAGTTPVAGGLNNSGLNTAAGSPYATINAALWSGYVARLQGSGGVNQMYSRPVQNGTGTTSANQDLVGNNFGAGAYGNPAGVSGTAAGGSSASTLALTVGNQYTESVQITLGSGNTLLVGEQLFSGPTIGGTLLAGVTNSFASVIDTSFSGLAIGARNSSAATNSMNPQMTINNITITDSLQQPVPEPSTIALAGIGLGLTLLARFRRR